MAVTTTTIETTLVTLVDIQTGFSDRIGIQVSNTGATALNAFQMHGSIDGTTWVALATDAGGYSTPLLPLRRTIGAPVTLAGGATAQLLIDGGYYQRLRLRASVASGSTTAAVTVCGNR